MLITHEDDVATHAKRVVRMRDGDIVSDVRQAGLTDPPPRMAVATTDASALSA